MVSHPSIFCKPKAVSGYMYMYDPSVGSFVRSIAFSSMVSSSAMVMRARAAHERGVLGSVCCPLPGVCVVFLYEGRRNLPTILKERTGHLRVHTNSHAPPQFTHAARVVRVNPQQSGRAPLALIARPHDQTHSARGRRRCGSGSTHSARSWCSWRWVRRDNRSDRSSSATSATARVGAGMCAAHSAA